MSSPDSRILPILRAASSADAGHSHERLQADVVALFDQFREPLLRYMASLGLAFPDGEEVLQEVFLALFQHLRDGKSRENLRGWLFRVAHNLALKRRYRTRRDFAARAEPGVADTVAEPGPNPEDQLLEARLASGCWPWSGRWRNRIASVFFCGPRACAIGRSPGFSTCRWARYRFRWPGPWRASRAQPNGEEL